MKPVARVTVTLKLTPGKDDDLIAWWQATVPGRRNRLLKKVLRAYVGGISGAETEQQQIARMVTDVAWLKAALAELPTHLAQIIGNLSIAAPDAGATATRPAPGAALSDLDMQRREKRMSRTTW